MTKSKRPNILFFFTDDQRFDTIAALGNPEIKTPNIDELVKTGTTFTHAHIPGGSSPAVCMPSRAMLHTGRTLFHIEREGQEIPKNHALMGEALRQSGYRTFGTGKWHNGKDAFARSFSDGDEVFFGGMGDHWNVPAYHFDPTGKYDTPRRIIERPFTSNEVKYDNTCDHIYSGKHSSELFCECSTKWIEKYKSNDPFFMYISFMAPHDPRSMPEEFLSMYDPEKINLPQNFIEEHPFNYGIRELRDEVLADYPRTQNEIKRHIAEYYGMITHLDNELGKVINALKASGKYEDTIIVFAGDNGLAVGQHGLMGKQSGYEHSIRVPLIFAGPGVPKGERCDTYAYLLDIFPTLCELVDIDIPESVEGISLVPSIKDPSSVARETIYFAYTDIIRGVKDNQYKLVEYRNDGVKQTQIFDIINDPCELSNLFGLEKYKSVEKRLRDELIRYRDEWSDTLHPLGEKFWGRY